MRTRVIVFMFSLVHAACIPAAGEIKPTFFFTHDEARMPVVVRGNIQSGIFILFLHGGPGGSSLKKIGTRSFNLLEEKFGLIYWDQRGADGASGGMDRKWMNIDQYVEDLDILIDHLNQLYPKNKLFLMGHSWGGALGIAYLVDPWRQQRITGWIEVAGAHNNPLGDSLSAIWVQSYARKMISEGNEVNYWKKSLEWYRANTRFRSDDLRHYKYVSKAGGYQYATSDTLGCYPGYTKADILRKPLRCVSYYLNYYRTLSKFIISDINLTPKMGRIKLPVLIIWGEKDGVIPVSMAKQAYDAIGTESDKSIEILPNAAHTLYYEQPVLFAEHVKCFVHKVMQKKDEISPNTLAVSSIAKPR